MHETVDYPIGSIGQKWGAPEKAMWRAQQSIKRSYKKDVLTELESIDDHFKKQQYATLFYLEGNYPLYALKSSNWQDHLPTILVTGGVHGYETSGVHGALHFAKNIASQYLKQFNFIIAPCISPWGYETINRWNPDAVDPNRSFYRNSPAQESQAIMDFLHAEGVSFLAHIDLHETTDTDNSEFRPALAARDAFIDKYSEIPDGFYLVGDKQKPQHDFQKAIIERVQSVSHIAQADTNQELIGTPITQFGVINYEARALGLCMGLTDAPYVTTTEVYPDSPRVNDKDCIDAQVEVIVAALEFLQKR
ncbi:peptidase [Psychromonas sp. psych-6C06]|uniref:M14 family metallopeptidase n=1 Tax=Psychromonas sp. psych-6C06 TaxID=2058089 RepID=UPI000C3393C4|nr:M14 family metallocarboxypeptidase [Psychromonas sp. psych-6C06]PKF61036.1 peptidase [Psychromonas sp. psych-6C06]